MYESTQIKLIPARYHARYHADLILIASKGYQQYITPIKPHYDDVIMDAIASQITSLASVYSDV